MLNGDTDCMPDESQDVMWQRTVAGNIRTYPCPKEHLGKKKLGVEEKIQGLPKKESPNQKKSANKLMHVTSFILSKNDCATITANQTVN